MCNELSQLLLCVNGSLVVSIENKLLDGAYDLQFLVTDEISFTGKFRRKNV